MEIGNEKNKKNLKELKNQRRESVIWWHLLTNRNVQWRSSDGIKGFEPKTDLTLT